MKSLLKSCACLLAAVFVCLPPGAAAQALARVSVGSLERLAVAPSKFIEARPVEVWLPEGYAAKARAGKRFKVLYMHDGQMLFDPATTWNKTAWNVHEVLARLMREGKVADTIIVGIWNNARFRASEYVPPKFLERMPAAAREGYERKFLENRPQADNYLRFLVTELKPLIDRRYATQSDQAGTFIMGSSMGGLISVYAFNEYPQVFGGAAGLSTHWVGSFEPNASIPLGAFDYLNEKLAPPQGRRLYLDHGTATLDALYGPSQAFVDQIVREHGYADADYMSGVYEGAEHTETAWSNRVDVPLLFLLGRH
jgi:enterochelin esterase-like enzyme